MTTTEERILNQLRPALLPIIKTFGKEMDIGNNFIRFKYLDEPYELKLIKKKPRKNGTPNKTSPV